MARIQLVSRLLFLAPLAIAACTLTLFRAPVPAATAQISPTAATDSANLAPTSLQASASAPTGDATARSAAAQAAATSPFCADEQPRALIAKFRSAILASDSAGLAALVSAEHGVDARLFRDGRVVNYDREHAAALFASSFAVNWGTAPGSGLATIGSFQELLVPDLLDVLTKNYVLSCNEIRVGGTTYTAAWPHTGIDYYSMHFPGTPASDGLDWHTWLLGMHYVGGNPYLYAMMQFEWEP
ncbi:MAG: hypothetical protein V1755_09250 [Chloroflexota bacterium]